METDTNPRWGGVARRGEYANARKSASPIDICDAASCSTLQNEAGTCGEKWHKSDTSSSPDVPVGGSTGLCHQSTAAISEAAAWYRDNRQSCERPIIPALRRRFGLTALEAINATREANGIAVR